MEIYMIIIIEIKHLIYFLKCISGGSLTILLKVYAVQNSRYILFSMQTQYHTAKWYFLALFHFPEQKKKPDQDFFYLGLRLISLFLLFLISLIPIFLGPISLFLIVLTHISLKPITVSPPPPLPLTLQIKYGDTLLYKCIRVY